MGGAARAKPQRLAKKLYYIRQALGITQQVMVEELGFSSEIARSNITRFEQGNREPSLLILLAYARLANVSTDVLIDDDLDLPTTIPSPYPYGAQSKSKSRPSS